MSGWCLQLISRCASSSYRSYFWNFNCWRQTSSQWSGCWRETVRAHVTCAHRDVLQKHISHLLFLSKMESSLASEEGKFCWGKNNYLIFILWVKITIQVSKPWPVNWAGFTHSLKNQGGCPIRKWRPACSIDRERSSFQNWNKSISKPAWKLLVNLRMPLSTGDNISKAIKWEVPGLVRICAFSNHIILIWFR